MLQPHLHTHIHTHNLLARLRAEEGVKGVEVVKEVVAGKACSISSKASRICLVLAGKEKVVVRLPLS